MVILVYQIRLQLETLLAEKARLAQENSVLTRENRFLREIVEYHQLTMQDVVYLDETNEEVTEVYPIKVHTSTNLLSFYRVCFLPLLTISSNSRLKLPKQPMTSHPTPCHLQSLQTPLMAFPLTYPHQQKMVWEDIQNHFHRMVCPDIESLFS